MKKTLILILIGVTILSCSKNDDLQNRNNCDSETLISAVQYTNTPSSDELMIDNLEINGDCLKISFNSGGCNGDTWELKLIDKGEITESLPPQRSLRLALKNEESCEKLIWDERTFDISNLRTDGNQVKLNITNSNDNILYEY